MSLFSIQSASTITLLQETTLDKIDAANSYHTSYSYQLTPSMNHEHIYNSSWRHEVLDEYIAELNEVNNIELIDTYIKVHSSALFYSVSDNIEEISGPDDLNSSIVRGYSNENGMNNYEVLEGKPLDELSEYELAIPYQYNEVLKERGLNYKELFFYDATGIEPYKVVSIYDSPNYIAEVDASLNIPENDKGQQIWSYASIDNHQILANEERMEALSEEKINGNSQGFNTYLIRLSDYSEYNDSLLGTFLVGTYQNNSRSNIETTYREVESLYYEMQSESIVIKVFQYLVYTMLLALIVADLFVFYSFIKRKLEENKERIGIMLITGIQKKNIMLAFLSSHVYIFLVGIGIYGVINFFMYYVFKLHLNTDINALYNISPSVLGATAIGVLLLFIVICIVTIIQIQVFTKKGLFLLVKEKELSLKKTSKIKLNFKSLSLSYALRDLFSSPYKLIRICIAIVFLLLSILITYTSYQSVSNVYNEDTLGITFDYMIDPIDDKQLEGMEEYIQDISAFQVKNTTSYMERLEDYEYINIYKYYNVASIFFYNHMDPFMSELNEGVIAQPEMYCYETECDYTPTSANASNRIMSNTNTVLKEDVTTSTSYNDKIFKMSTSIYSLYYGNYSFEVNGVQDSLINDGYVTFVPSYENLYFSNESPSFMFQSLVNVNQGTADKFESYLEENEIEYVAYDEYIHSLNESNSKVNKNLFTVLVYVLSMLCLLLIIVIIANVLEDESYKKVQYERMIKIGYTRSLINKVRVSKPIITLCLSLLLSILLFSVVRIVYFSYLETLLGLSKLDLFGLEAMVGYLVLSIVLCIVLVVSNAYKKQ